MSENIKSSNELVLAIVSVLEFVHSHPDKMTVGEVNEFEELCNAVYILALESDVAAAIPKVTELSPELHSNGLRLPPIKFIGKLNLPGDWLVRYQDDEPLWHPSVFDDLPELQAKVFHVCTSFRWLADMDMLRKLADRQASHAEDIANDYSKAHVLDPNARLNHIEIAELLKVKADPLRKRLDRWRSSNKGSDSWSELTEPARHQPKYLYQLGPIRKLLREVSTLSIRFSDE